MGGLEASGNAMYRWRDIQHARIVVTALGRFLRGLRRVPIEIDS